MRVYDAASYDSLLERPEFNPPVSLESNHRRDFYRLDQKREQALSSFQGEYLAFLKNCQIQLSIYTPKSSNIDRIQELVQRTNQLNFSGNRYGREEIEKILEKYKPEKVVLTHIGDELGATLEDLKEVEKKFESFGLKFAFDNMKIKI